jgi:hypothetical protein
MANFTPDDIFKASFGSQNNMVPNDALWRKIEKELIEKAQAKKLKKRNNSIAFASCFMLLFIAAGGYLSLQKQHPNAITTTQTLPQTNGEDQMVKNNNTPTNYTSPKSVTTNNTISKSNLSNSQVLFNNFSNNILAANANILNSSIPQAIVSNNTKDALNNFNAEEVFIEEDLQNVAFNNTKHDDLIGNIALKPITNYSLNKTTSLPKTNSLIKPISNKGHVSKGLFVGGVALKGYDNKLGYGAFVQHQKHISTQVALTSGVGILNLPTAYKYTKVAYKEGLPTQLDAQLYQLNMVYMQMGVTYYPKNFNKQKPNLSFSLYAMPAIITNVKATTNASNPEIDRRMERQINRTHFMTGATVSKNIAPRLWLDAGATFSFSTLTNGVFLNKTNSVNNVMYTQVGLKYQLR